MQQLSQVSNAIRCHSVEEVLSFEPGLSMSLSFFLSIVLSKGLEPPENEYDFKLYYLVAL